MRFYCYTSAATIFAQVISLQCFLYIYRSSCDPYSHCNQNSTTVFDLGCSRLVLFMCIVYATVFYYTQSQLQYVVPKIALDPSTICRDLNICTSSPSTQSFAVNSILRLFHKHLNKTNVKNPVAKLQPRPGLDSSSSDSSHLLNTQENPLRKKAVQPKSGKITFLQLADIHIDRDYAEVSLTNSVM